MRELLAPLEPEFADDDVLYESDSSDGLADFFIENFGPLVTLRAALPPDRWAALDADLRAMVADQNQATDGSMRTTARYLITTVRVP